MAYNSDYFNLKNWKLTLPVDSKGGTGGEALEIVNLVRYESTHFYDASDRAMVFTGYANGATTSGSEYVRSELREMNGSSLAAWKLSTGGTMTATLKVDQVPRLDNGAHGRIIVGQIHGEDEEPVRLYWDTNKVYFMNDQAGSGNDEMKFTFKNSSGQEPTISIGEKFSYKIDARGDTLRVDIYADGQVYTSTSKLNSVWQSDTFYFKAGLYLGVNEDNGTGMGKVSFYGLDVGHTPGSGLGGLTPGNPPPPQEPEPPVPNPEIAGTNNSETLTGTGDANFIRAKGGNDIVRGQNGNDNIYGDDGNDKLYGDAHNDILYGGAGTDTLDGGIGNDHLIGGTGNDTAAGGDGRDTFIVNRGDQGLTIRDFSVSDGDSLLLKGYSAVDLLLAKFSGNEDAVLTLSDGASIKFEDMSVSGMTGTTLKAEINNIITAFIPGKPILPAEPEHPVIPTPTKVGTGNADKINGSDEKNDVIAGRGGNDTLNGEDGEDRLYGEDGNDTLHGNDDDDHLDGGAGSDTLYGDGDDDVLLGGAGADRLYGDDGEDVLSGGFGQDRLYGGDGDDIFVFSQMPDIHDILADFDARDDRIDIDALLGSKGVASIKEVSGDSRLYVDPDGSGSSKAILIATFDEEISAGKLSSILV